MPVYCLKNILFDFVHRHTIISVLDQLTCMLLGYTLETCFCKYQYLSSHEELRVIVKRGAKVLSAHALHLWKPVFELTLPSSGS